MISNSQMLSLPSQQPLVSSSNDHHETLDNLLSSYSQSSNSLLYNLSILKEKLHQIQSIVNISIYNLQHSTESLPSTLAPSPPLVATTTTVNSLIQELIMAASSMLFTCQQMDNLVGNASLHNNSVDNNLHGQQHHHHQQRQGPVDDDNRRSLFNIANNHHHQHQEWYNTTSTNYNNDNNNSRTMTTKTTHDHRNSINIIELDASDLLAKYTHYCQICGKGFKRDANLRMHMRAHGDEYKASGALSNPEKSHRRDLNNISKMGTKYSCPQEGCRWNQKHVKFQPLKSLICVKNHFKRTHCPKMYVCKLCSRKKFSVLSDLRTHEKHCGDVKWLCSCGTTFSRKDKLMGHVALFVGHTPAIGSLTKFLGKQEHQYVHSF
ncbi:protein SENSITIVE TO PROTON RHIZOTOXICITY 2-like [Benincasa hispida]|uniref:protein SENSITIVE TO PROTON RHIZOTOXICITY 2-like n=1 Tax=Benincasa hispida TaxID=102211 RepID=UPI001900DA1E|nr:protein SENSITIVE TO PROTON RHIZOTOXICITY 2-like [Benincasa hispida]